MNKRCKVNYKSVLFPSITLLLLYSLVANGNVVTQVPYSFLNALTYSASKEPPRISLYEAKTVEHQPFLRRGRGLNATAGNDTLPVLQPVLTVKDSIQKKDSLIQKIDTFDIKYSKDSIDAPVEFEAEDSMVLDIPNKKIYLYNNSSIKFKDVSLNASVIRLDQETQILTAYSTTDTAGKRIGVPSFKQAESAFTSDSIRYNFKTQRGLTIGTYTQEGEMFIYGEKVKRISPSVFFAQKARFTVCNYDTPHFAFKSNKVKFISNQIAVTGSVRPEIENIPIPIGLPFGLFPMKQGRRTGLLPPQPVANIQLGFGLEGLGYYKTIGDYWDATIRANVYSYGSYNLFLSPTYRKRYRYSGGFNLSYMNNKIGFKGDPDYSPPSRNFSIQWNHSLDGKARPGQSFSASVNVATSLFNKFFPSNAVQNFNNTLTSSVAYQRNWAGKPFTLTVSANHNQNTNTKLFNVSLPDVGFTVNTIYPFQKKEMVGSPKWYEKLGVSYNASFKNQFSFYDTAFSFKQLIDTFQWGAKHSVPIQLSLPQLGPIQIGPSISFDETWYAQEFIRKWNSSSKKIDTIVNRGFYSGRQMSFGLSFSTAVFGSLYFKNKNSNIKALRHVIRPTIGLSYRPNMAKNQWYTEQVDTTGRTYRFNKFDGSLYGGLSEGESGYVSFGLDNNLEMKVRNKVDSSEDGTKKIRLIDGFGVSTGYNLLADSFQLSDFNIYVRSNLFDKISLTAGTNITPYQVDKSTGFRKKQYTWQGGDKFSLGRFTNGFISLSTQFKSKPKDEKKEKEKQDIAKNNRANGSYDELSRELNAIQRNPNEFVDFNIPWSINLSYALNFNRQLKRDYSGFETVLSQSVSVNGDFNLTEKWKMQGSGTFDLQAMKLQYFTTSISRDLHCWQLSINVTPIGIYRSFSITINPKSALLRDLRINRSRFFYNPVQY